MGILGLQAQAQTILNGSFENHPQDTACGWWNIERWNDDMSFSTAIDGFETYLFSDFCADDNYNLSIPKDGNWFVFPASMDTVNFVGNPFFFESSFSLRLSSLLNSGDWYKLSFYQKSPNESLIDTLSWCYDNDTHVRIGLSQNPNNFGSLIYTSPIVDTAWNLMEVVFQATGNIEHICVSSIATQGCGWVFLDDFRLHTDTNASVGVAHYSIAKPKKLLRIVDLLGRESKPKPNVPLFYIYDDGTVEKRLIIE